MDADVVFKSDKENNNLLLCLTMKIASVKEKLPTSPLGGIFWGVVYGCCVS